MGSLALELESSEPVPAPVLNGHAPSPRGRGRRTPVQSPATRRRVSVNPRSRVPSLSFKEQLGNSTSLSKSTSTVSDEDALARSEAEAASALSALHEGIASSSRLVALLKGLDRPVSAAGPSGPLGEKSRISSGSRIEAPSDEAAASTIRPALLEDRLQAHLMRLGEAERLREEQAREAAFLARELANVRGEGLEVDLDVLRELLMPSEVESTPGWTGEVARPDTFRPPRTNGFTLDTIEASPPSPSPLSPVPVSPISPVSGAFPRIPPSPTATTFRAVLPSSAAVLVDETGTLTSTLSTLSESISLVIQRHANETRTLRRARLGLKDWHERETAEETCQRGIDAWEDREAKGQTPNARIEMEQMLAGFRDILDAAASRFGQLESVRPAEIGVAL